MSKYFLVLLFYFCSCKQETKSSLEYVHNLDDRYTNTYVNRYNEKGRLISRGILNVTINNYGMGTDTSEEFYFYDSRDSLIRKEYHAKTDTDISVKKIRSITHFTDSTREYIYFYEYPEDTLSYSFVKKDKRGNIIEEYRKTKAMGIEGEIPGDEYSVKYKYNDKDNCVLEVRNTQGKEEVTDRKYSYTAKNDTTFTQVFINGVLGLTSKKYRLSENTKLEVTEYLGEYKSIDSLYYKNGLAVKEIKYDTENNKRVTITEYDERGNEKELINEYWVFEEKQE